MGQPQGVRGGCRQSTGRRTRGAVGHHQTKQHFTQQSCSLDKMANLDAGVKGSSGAREVIYCYLEVPRPCGIATNVHAPLGIGHTARRVLERRQRQGRGESGEG